MANIAVIGAGLGGLSSAIRLAIAGHKVNIFEASSSAGGKAGEIEINGVRVDTGPSVLTMPNVFEDLFKLAGWKLEDKLELIEPSPAFRYIYPDGGSLDIFSQLDESVASVRQTLGTEAENEFVKFLHYSKEIWEISAPEFIFGPKPTWMGMIRMGLNHITKIHKVDPLRSMHKAIRQQIKTKELQWLFLRYATYNGSDPRFAPATLNCIAHVELALGGYAIKGGIYRLISSLCDLALHHGVTIHYDSLVDSILLAKNRIQGIKVGSQTHQCDAVVANADAAHVVKKLLPPNKAGAFKAAEPVSMSGWTGIYKAHHRENLSRVAHTVLFPNEYENEFIDIFDHNRPPQEPTVYLCAQTQCHQRQSWPDAEAVFAMINTPPEPQRAQSPPDTWIRVQSTVRSRLLSHGLMAKNDDFVWTRTPSQLNTLFPGSRGAIYGASSNTKGAAFNRPANRIKSIKGLYLASGSAHPGGGMPLAVLSGKAAAAALIEDF